MHKDTSDLIGWEILGGVYEPFPFTDPFTGTEYTLLNSVEFPVTQKGNRPGDFPGGEDLEYYQDYDGVMLTFGKRFANHWGLNASYTWSRSEGRIPRMLSQAQFNPFYGSKGGSDPNQWLNTDSFLQGDRPHMFRTQFVSILPYDIEIAAAMELSSGRAHSRQIRVFGMEQGSVDILMDPIGTFRYDPIDTIDLRLAKKFYTGGQSYFTLEGWIFNLLNSDQNLWLQTQRLQEPGEEFISNTWLKPRRLQIRVGFYF